MQNFMNFNELCVKTISKSYIYTYKMLFINHHTKKGMNDMIRYDHDLDLSLSSLNDDT